MYNLFLPHGVGLIMRATYADGIADRIRGKEEITPSKKSQSKTRKIEWRDI